MILKTMARLQLQSSNERVQYTLWHPNSDIKLYTYVI